MKQRKNKTIQAINMFEDDLFCTQHGSDCPSCESARLTLKIAKKYLRLRVIFGIVLILSFLIGFTIGWVVDPFSPEVDIPIPTPTITIAPSLLPTPSITVAPTLTIAPTTLSINTIHAKEYMLFVEIVAREATFAYGYSGAIDVATVIMNRLERGWWGDSITSVVSAPAQFSTYNELMAGKKSILYPFYYQAVDDVLNGIRSLPVEVVYFRTYASFDSMDATKQSRYIVVARRNGHVFCR
jgi:hypothetical protein